MEKTNPILQIEQMKIEASSAKERETKSELGQFFTNTEIATLMAKMFDVSRLDIRMLDPGAGVGALTASYVSQVCSRKHKPKSLEVVAVEVDESIIPYLKQTLEICSGLCRKAGIPFSYQIINSDFLEYGKQLLQTHFVNYFDAVIMNPPYKKIGTDSLPRLTVSSLGVETSNLYTAFLAVAKRLLADSGQLVAITPRSFCNGTYFKNFRVDFLHDMSFKRIHLLESRKEAFSADDVLQENIVFLAEKNKKNRKVDISYPVGNQVHKNRISVDNLIQPTDSDKFIRIIKTEQELLSSDSLERVLSNFEKLNLQVSTGKVVDFRSKEHLRHEVEDDTVPLIYPFHFYNGFVRWPVYPAVKANAIVRNNETQRMLLPRGNYVVIRRFSSKEEPKRIVAVIYDESKIQTEFVGFENHVNFFHKNGAGMPLEVAYGLCLYLNSTIVDRYFRQFNGHTQVNVGDLKSLPYPSYEEILQIGQLYNGDFPDQQEIDSIISTVLGIS